jgi:hypothetical protein
VTTAQLAIFDTPGDVVLTKAEAGLAQEIPAGPAKLLAELLKHGLERECLPVAASLVLVLDEGTSA